MGIDVLKIALKNTFVPLKVTLIPNVFYVDFKQLNLNAMYLNYNLKACEEKKKNKNKKFSLEPSNSPI